MLEMPRRSVTRFFIPLIDVLTLLFCVFLVMPLAKGTGEDAAADAEKDVKKLQSELDRLHSMGADEPEKLRTDLEKLRNEKSQAILDRISIKTLEIDGTNGELSYRSGSGPVPIRSESDLLRLVEEHRRKAGGREVVYQILYPADPESRYPTREQRRRIDGWFIQNRIPYELSISGTEKKGS